MILAKIRDKRFITLRRGGTLVDDDHRLLAIWAAKCAQHVLHYFDAVRPDDDRPRRALESTHAWVIGETSMMQASTSLSAQVVRRICWQGPHQLAVR